MKFSNPEAAFEFTQARDYVEVNRAAVREMHRQVGDLIIDDHGIASRGLLVRHLVLPEGMSGTEETVKFIAQEISPSTYVNLMSQYRPCYRADEYPPLDRPIMLKDFRHARELCARYGLNRLDRG
jgi:putative pyruvate formate lyase activating enzyme